MLIREDKNKEAQYLPVELKAVFPVEMDYVRRQYKGVKINELSSLWPEADLRRMAMKAAKQFVSDMQKRGYDLAQNESDLLLWGPYRPRKWNLALSGNFTATAHTEFDTPLTVGTADFLITGSFVAKYARMTEVTS